MRYSPHEYQRFVIDYIKKNPIARQVKIADLRHNSTLSRLDSVGQKDLERVAKYNKALDFLTEDEK